MQQGINMPPVEVLVYVLSGAMTLITLLIGVVWKMLRAESHVQSKTIEKKADTERLHEVEIRWQSELSSVKEGNEKLITKLEQRHDRDLDQLSARLTEQIRATEGNILAQIRLMIEAIKASA